MKRNSVQRIGLAVVCGAAGYLLNRWRMGSAAPLLLGRIATLPIAILFGPWYGAAAAMLAPLPASGPYSVGVVLLPIEAVVAGAFARPGRSRLVGAPSVWTAVAPPPAAV